MLYISIWQDFLQAKPPYQYGFIRAFYDLWLKNSELLSWNETWSKLFDFFSNILNRDFWNKEIGTSASPLPDKESIADLICDFLSSGMRSDAKAFSSELLPPAKELVINILNNIESKIEPDADFSFNMVANSSKSKAIESLLLYALRRCRLEHQKLNNHDAAWHLIEDVFEKELKKCKNSNFEFSAFMGAYIEQLNYLSTPWLALAYLWSDTKLDFLFTLITSGYVVNSDLDYIAEYFWKVQNQIAENMPYIQRIGQFWTEAIKLNNATVPNSENFSLLICYLPEKLSLNNIELLNKTVPSVFREELVLHRFIRELERLTKQNPEFVLSILDKISDNLKPYHGYNEHLLSILTILSSSERSNQKYIVLLNKLKYFPSIQSIYNNFTK